MSEDVVSTLRRWALVAIASSAIGLVVSVARLKPFGPVLLEIPRPGERRWLPNRDLLPAAPFVIAMPLAIGLRYYVNPLVVILPLIFVPMLYRRRRAAIRETGIQWGVSELPWRDIESVGWFADSFVVETRERARTRPSQVHTWVLSPQELTEARAVISKCTAAATPPVVQREVTESR